MAQTFIDLILEAETQLLKVKKRNDVKRWLNIAQREICRAYSWPFTELVASTPTKADTPNFYSLPRDFRLPKSVRFEASDGNVSKLTVVSSAFEDEASPKQTGQGPPKRAIFTGGLLLLRPGAQDTSGKVLLRYYRTPPKMDADGDFPLLPDADTDLITLGAVAVGSRWLWNDKGHQDRVRAEFIDGLRGMVRNYFRQPASSSMLNADSAFAAMIRTQGGAA